MTIVPEGSGTRFAWSRDAEAPETWPIRFVSAGECVVDTASVRRTLADLVDSVLARLSEQGVRETALFEEWRANTTLPSDERDFCLASARLGLDPYAITPEVAEDLVRAGKELDEDLLGDFLDAVDSAALKPGLKWIETSSKLIRSSDATTNDGRVSAIRAAVAGMTPNGGPRPWTVGYEQAARAREALGLHATEAIASEELIAVRRANAPDRGLQGLGGESQTHSPTLVLGGTVQLGSATRFASARALWHFASQPGRKRFLLTPTRTDVRRIERAFAAELLAPAAGLRKQFPGGPAIATDDDLDAVAAHYGVSSLVIRHQIDNQLLAA